MKSALELVVGIVAVPRGESGLKSKYHQIRDCQPLFIGKITKQPGKSKHIPGLRYREQVPDLCLTSGCPQTSVANLIA
jgi:hypothetical protein